jgi:hypothetical protein
MHALKRQPSKLEKFKIDLNETNVNQSKTTNQTNWIQKNEANSKQLPTNPRKERGHLILKAPFVAGAWRLDFLKSSLRWRF